MLDDADVTAARDPGVSIWVVTNQPLGHTTADYLVNPASGHPRVGLDPTILLNPTTALAKYELAAPGCSELATYGKLDTQTIRNALPSA